MNKISLILIFLVFVSFGVVSADEWSSNDADDSWIEFNNPDENHGSSTILRVGFDNGNFNEYKSLLRFDLDGLNVSKINSAKLMLFVQQFPPPSDTIHFVSRILEKWSENTVTWNNQPEVSGISSRAFVRQEDSYRWVEFDVTEDVRDFLMGNSENHGWMIEDAFFSLNNVRMRYRSDETSNSSMRPKLIVDY